MLWIYKGTYASICMGPSGNKKGGLNLMTLGSMKKMTEWSWCTIMMPDTVIDWVNALGQGQPNDQQLLDYKKHPNGDLEITVVDDGETEAPHIELVEPDTDLKPISARSETLLDLV